MRCSPPAPGSSFGAAGRGPPRPRLGLLAQQVRVTGLVECDLQRVRVVAGVVLPPGLRRVRELLGPQEVLHAQLGGIHAELVGEHVDDALDEVHRLGDAERAGVRDATGRLVRVHAGDLAVRGLQVVAAGEDVEEAGGVLRRLRRAVERAVVGEHVDAQAEDLAVAGGGDLAVHVVVAGEPGRHQVLRAVLHPLHRLAGDDRTDDDEHVARVDRHLVAEAAADVGRDDLDLVLGQAGHQRVHRAVGVRRLGGGVDGELARHLVHVGDAAAGLHGCGMAPRVQHVLGHDDVGGREHVVAQRLVARLPVEDVVVGLAFDVVTDHRGARVEARFASMTGASGSYSTSISSSASRAA